MKEKEAMRKYNQILKKEIYPLVGRQSTFLNDLDKVGRKLFGISWRGVFPSDKIPKLNDLKPYCILNLDKSTQGGSHWVAVAKIHGENKTLIYDSFARSNKQIIPALQKSGNGRIIDTDRDIEQKIEQQDCGARSIGFLVFLDKYGAEAARLI